jgi:Bacterial Ig domain
VSITVANAAPVAVDDTANTDTNQGVGIGVLANDTDPNPTDTLEIDTFDGTSAHGAVTQRGNLLFYTPADGFKGTDTFTYRATDGDRTSNQATVTVTVRNEEPTAVDDEATTNGAAVSVPVLDNDVDPNGDSLSIAGFDTTSRHGGSITRDGDELVYTPAPGFHGDDTSTYVVSDGDGRDTGTLMVTVRNTAPVANDDDSSSTPHFTPVLVDVLANDTDLNGDALRITEVTAPVDDDGQTRGNASVIDGKVRYAPPEGFAGQVTFHYTVTDGHLGTDTATVTVTVDNASPFAVADEAVTDTNTQMTIDVLANDSDPNGDPISVISVTDPANGSVTVEDDGSLTYYAPAPGFKGPDNFDYTISDGNGGTATATVRVTVGNAPPDARGETRTMSGDSITVAVLANDTDPNGDTLVIAAFDATSAHGGTVTQQGQSLTYTPAAGFHGEDTVGYVVSDGDGGTDTATLTIEVTNAPPDASPDTVATEADANGSTTIDVLANDTDPNRDTLTITNVTAASHGTVAIVNGKLVYSYQDDFAGTDTFNYSIEDGHEGTSTAKVAVTVTNTKPMAVDDDAGTDPARSVTINVLANDSDPNGDAISLESVANPAHGSASIVAGKVVYTPDGAFHGVDAFSYTIRDARGATDSGTISVTTRYDLTVSAHDVVSGISHQVSADIHGVDPAGSAVLTVRFIGIPLVVQSPSQCSRSGSTFTCPVSNDGTVGPFHFLAAPGSWSATFDVSPVGFEDADPTNNHDRLP